MFDVLTIGAALWDVFLLSDRFQLIKSDAFEGGVGECVALGAKIEVDQVVQATGGGAANASVTFARLGFKTGILCRVGDDAPGRDVLAALEKEGVDAGAARVVKGGNTGYSTLLTAKTGERTALTHRGVSAAFTAADIPKTLRTRAVYLSSLGGSLARAGDVVRAAEKAKAIVFWNPGGKELAAGRVAVLRVAKKVHVLNLNREEGAAIAGSRDLDAIFDALRRPDAITLVTDGPDGAYAETPNARWKVGTTKVKSVSRTGAGDAFGSGFAAGLLSTGDVPTALAVATLNAESVIKHVGAAKGLLTTFPKRAALKKIPLARLA